MKIWFVSAYDAPGGQSSRTSDFATELSRLGHSVTIVTSGFNHFSKEEILSKSERFRVEYRDGIRVVWLKTYPYKGNGWQRALNMLSNAWRAYFVGRSIEERPDVIFGPSVPLFTALSAYCLARKKRTKFCFEVRDIWPQALIDLGLMKEGSLPVKVFRQVEKYLYRRSDHIVAVLPFANRHITKYGVPNDKITWIPNGVNIRRFEGQAAYAGGTPGALVVMYIGGFATTHGIDTIIDAARQLQELGDDRVSFVLIGAGRSKSENSELAQRYGLKNLQLLPLIPKHEIAARQEQADVLVASVKDTPVYQFGINSNKIFDYLASGRPIIFAGNTPNDPVKEASAGISIPPEDCDAMVAAIRELADMTPAARAQLGRNGREHARTHLDTKLLAKKLEQILLNL